MKRRFVWVRLQVCLGLLSQGCAGHPRGQSVDDTRTTLPQPSARCTEATLCISDTTRSRSVIATGATVVLFLEAGDSIEVDGRAATGREFDSFGMALSSLRSPALEMLRSSSDGWRHLAGRISHSGAFSLEITVQMDDNLDNDAPFDLRIRNHRSAPGWPPKYGAGILTISADQGSSVALIPRSITRSGHLDPAEWGIRKGPYKVILAPDSVYDLFILPCRQPSDSVVLRPGGNATISLVRSGKG